jgi:hypothetical protein
LVPKKIRAEAIAGMKKKGWTVKDVVQWLKETHGITVTEAAVYNWKGPDKKKKPGRLPKEKEKRPYRRKEKAETVVLMSSPQSRTEPIVKEFTDGCMLSIPSEKPDVLQTQAPFICAKYPRVLCGGTIPCKQKCPEWNRRN